jgi:hypothetical protein
LGLSACDSENITPVVNSYPQENVSELDSFESEPHLTEEEYELEPPINKCEPDPDPMPISDLHIQVFWATDEFLEKYTVYNEFFEVDDAHQRWAVSRTRDTFGWDETNLRRIAFTANREVNFRFLEAADTGWSAPYYVWLAVYTLYEEVLSPEMPIIITWDEWMKLPYRFVGIWYFHDTEFSAWTQKVYAIDVQDGELSLVPVYDLLEVLYTEFEYDNLFAWGGEENLVMGAESPTTQIVGFFNDLQSEWGSIAISVPDVWALAWTIMRETADTENGSDMLSIERAEKIKENLLREFSDHIVTHEYPWLGDEITLTLTEDTAQLVYNLLATMSAVEHLQPRHSGHPLHASTALLIRIEFSDGTKMVIHICVEAANIIRTTGTYTWHRDPGVILARNAELLSLLLSHFLD